MKRVLYLLIISLLSGTAAPAAAQLSVGGLLGLNISGLRVVPDISSEEYSSYAGFGIGGVVDYALGDVVDIHGTPMLLQRGGKITEGTRSATLKILYLEVPVFLRYTIELDGDIWPYIIAGPHIGMRLQANAVYPGGVKDPVDDQFAFFDLGAAFGGGVHIHLDEQTLFAEARYGMGFLNLNREAEESTVTNRGVLITAGITFPL